MCNGANDCEDCLGLPYGSAAYDVCNICGGRNDPVQVICSPLQHMNQPCAHMLGLAGR